MLHPFEEKQSISREGHEGREVEKAVSLRFLRGLRATLSKMIRELLRKNHKFLTLCDGWVTLLADDTIRNNQQQLYIEPAHSTVAKSSASIKLC